MHEFYVCEVSETIHSSASYLTTGPGLFPDLVATEAAALLPERPEGSRLHLRTKWIMVDDHGNRRT